MSLRFAFAGFRHGHIFSLLGRVHQDPACELVAACEPDAATRVELAASGKVEITHESLADLLADTPCDVVAIGDYYGARGDLAIQALEAGKHVVVDKPLCTSLDELNRIESLAKAKGLAVGCQLDMRAGPTRQTLHRIVQSGEIGEVLTVSFSGQHPLMYGSRADWYFQPGCHGGTINDIGIHAMDLIPWVTGREITEVTAARAWNGKTPQAPHFDDCGQMMLRLDNGGGVLGDVSYLAPDACGYSQRQYWRFTIHGTKGVAEIRGGDPNVMVANHTDKEPREIPGEASPNARDYFADFRACAEGRPEEADLTTALVLRAARLALTVQHAAEQGLTQVAL
ncbi:MAG: Gfo/Idh/MocA family oxidoreductase [Victivallales bacterium]|nr:Gfo/Idh/MocA family oxidoreductase [Victivallales bacterium]